MSSPELSDVLVVPAHLFSGRETREGAAVDDDVDEVARPDVRNGSDAASFDDARLTGDEVRDVV